MNFRESESYLYSLGNEVSAMKLGLENITTLLAALGDPQKKYLKVQVAGTNGKGSVCAFLDAICVSAGVHTGVFTSPHLVSITERIRIDGRDISEKNFARHATTVRETAEALLAAGEIEYRPTFFEQVTAIALIAFADAGVDLAILETGLGGRLDATTAAGAEIAAITQIDYDHQEYLGETLEEIAAEKAAIIRRGARVVIAADEPNPALEVILKRCREAGVDPVLASGVEVGTKGRNTSGSECVPCVSFKTSKGHYENVRPGLLGRYQIENARVATLLAEVLQTHFPITTENIVEGLQNARHPGRLEYRGRFLFDGAHNMAGARALGSYLDEFVSQPITMVFGAMKLKDAKMILEILLPHADRVIFTQPQNSRAFAATDLAGFVDKDFSKERISTIDVVARAVDEAVEMAGEDGIILVTGSLYLVGEVQNILHQAFKGQ